MRKILYEAKTMDQQRGWKEYIVPGICTLIGAVAYEVSKGTANGGVIIVILGLFSIPFLTIASVERLRKKEWGSALGWAGLAAIVAFALWLALSDTPWHQLPEEIDKLLNIVMEHFR